jgi:hypothetical protein
MKKQILPQMVQDAVYPVPLGSSICPGWRLRARGGPYLQAGVHYDPTSLRPYTVECKHRFNECQIGVYWKYALYHLIAKQQLKPMILHIILNDGWATRIERAISRHTQPVELIANAIRPLNSYLWDPKRVAGWHDLNKTTRKVLAVQKRKPETDNEVPRKSVRYDVDDGVLGLQRAGVRFDVYTSDIAGLMRELTKFAIMHDRFEVHLVLQECLDVFNQVE